MKEFLTALVSAALVCWAPARASAFVLSPIVAQFTPQGDGATQSFFVENAADKDVAVQVDVYYRTQNGQGEEVRTETDQFSVYPSQIVLKPKQKRTIRVTWLGPKDISKELAFRLIAEELPVDLQKKKATRTNINFLLKYVASLYVTPEGAKPKVEVKKIERVQVKGRDHLALTLENAGGAHQVLNEIRLQVSAGGKTVDVNREALKIFETENLLAGGSKTFFIPWPQGLPEQKDVKVSLDFAVLEKNLK